MISSMNHRRYIAYTVARNGCSGGNLPPTGPEGRNRGTFVFVSSNAKTFVIDEVVPFNQTGYICYGASPWRGWMALGQRRYIGCTMYWVIPFNPTG